MSVNPGFGGQKFIERTWPESPQLRVIDEAGASAMIEITGASGLTTGQNLSTRERMFWLLVHQHSMHPFLPMRFAR